MLHRNSSAGTAAQKSSKCSLVQRPAIILAMLLLCAVFSSCKSYRLKNEYKEKHDKYRTLMYRSNFEKCFVDSSRKYGLLYDSMLGIKEDEVINWLDTATVNEPTPVCK